MNAVPEDNMRHQCSAVLHAIPVLLGLTLCAAPVHAQVAAVTEMKNDVATIEVRNPGTQMMSVEVALHHGTIEDGKLVLGDAVQAIVGPSSFRLLPGSAQTVRALLREAVQPGTVLRVVTTLTPVVEQPAGETQLRSRIVLATRLITKLIVH